MVEDDAQAYIMNKYQSMVRGGEATGKAVLAKCPTKVKTIELKNENDSLNYAFGLMNGMQARIYVLGEDAKNQDSVKVFIDNLNKGIKSDVHNPQVRSIGKNIGKDGRPNHPRKGFCLETQYYPDAINHPEWPQPLFGPEKPFDSETVYQFSW